MMRIILFIASALVLLACQQPVNESRWCDELPRGAYQNLEKLSYSNEWFEVYRVKDSIYAIYEPFQWQEVISYVIIGDEFALLFDSGNGIGNIKEIVSSITQLPVRVLNSHSHLDHVGGNADFDFIYGMNTEFTKMRMKGLPHERVVEEVSDEALCKGLPKGVVADEHYIRGYEIDVEVGDGFIIDLGNRKLEIISIPGHTPDAIALLDRENGLLWTGDSYYAGPIWLFMPETDWDAYKNSVEKIAKLAPSLNYLLPAHNTPLEDASVLHTLAEAVRKVDSGESAPKEQKDGNLLFEFQNFSLLLSREALR